MKDIVVVDASEIETERVSEDASVVRPACDPGMRPVLCDNDIICQLLQRFSPLDKTFTDKMSPHKPLDSQDMGKKLNKAVNVKGRCQRTWEGTFSAQRTPSPSTSSIEWQV